MKRLVVGCGYLGFRVAKRWLANGDSVFAVTRSETRAVALETEGISPIVGDVTLPSSLDNLPEVDTVLFSVGMDRSRYSDIRLVYVDGLRHILQRLSTATGHLIYISSTGVYGDFGGQWIDETAMTEPAREGGKACLEAEQLIASSDFANRSTILRFAGIYGPGRVPTRNLIQSGSWKKLSAAGYLNLIHVDDGARIVTLLADQPPTGETFLVSDGQPSLRKEYYEFIAGQFGVDEIPWEESKVKPEESRSESSKRVSNRKLMERFEFQFEFPDYRSGLKNALDLS